MRFTPDGGSPGYYDEHGRSMRRFFLASPLKFQPVVTSGFSSARMHPVLREVRAHLGVDYRAPAGAPVVAVADGVVVSAAMSGGAGRMVHLRHANGFETEYLHLSVISVRAGARVRQGELIGRVGSTGLATGAAPRLSPEEERRVHQPDDRASRDAAGRSDSRRRRWPRSNRRAIARWRRCPSRPLLARTRPQPCNRPQRLAPIRSSAAAGPIVHDAL